MAKKKYKNFRTTNLFQLLTSRAWYVSYRTLINEGEYMN